MARIEEVKYYCDRCGKELEDCGRNKHRRMIHIYHNTYIHFFRDWQPRDNTMVSSWDLCARCRKGLEKWLNKECDG